METERKKLHAINFSIKQKGEVTNHRTALDRFGEPLKMCKIYVPSKEYRPSDFQFDIDSQGIDRSMRKAYLNFPNNAVFVDKANQNRLYTYLDEQRTYKIHFNGQPVGEPGIDGKIEFDKPEPVEVSAQDLVKIFGGRREREKAEEKISKEKKPVDKEKRKSSKKKDIER